jgi:hypothetical protein
VQLQHACQKIAQWIDRPGDRVVRALSWLGKGAATDPIAIDTLRLNTSDPVGGASVARSGQHFFWDECAILTVT